MNRIEHNSKKYNTSYNPLIQNNSYTSRCFCLYCQKFKNPKIYDERQIDKRLDNSRQSSLILFEKRKSNDYNNNMSIYSNNNYVNKQPIVYEGSVNQKNIKNINFNDNFRDNWTNNDFIRDDFRSYYKNDIIKNYNISYSNKYDPNESNSIYCEEDNKLYKKITSNQNQSKIQIKQRENFPLGMIGNLHDSKKYQRENFKIHQENFLIGMTENELQRKSKGGNMLLDFTHEKKQINKQINKQTDEKIDKQTYKQIDKQKKLNNQEDIISKQLNLLQTSNDIISNSHKSNQISTNEISNLSNSNSEYNSMNTSSKLVTNNFLFLSSNCYINSTMYIGCGTCSDDSIKGFNKVSIVIPINGQITSWIVSSKGHTERGKRGPILALSWRSGSSTDDMDPIDIPGSIVSLESEGLPKDTYKIANIIPTYIVNICDLVAIHVIDKGEWNDFTISGTILFKEI